MNNFTKQKFNYHKEGKQFLKLYGSEIDTRSSPLAARDQKSETIDESIEGIIGKQIAGSNQVVKDTETSNQNQLDFFTKISHELRTPLINMLGIIDLLNQTELDKKQFEYTKKLSISSEYLLSLVNEILDYSKIKAGHLGIENSYFPLHQFIDETLQIVANMANQKGLKLCSELNPSINQNVFSDSRRLRQILINLLNNAIKFTDEGEVTIFAECHKDVDDWIVFDCRIQDTGIGIHPDEYQRLFDPFTQVQSNKIHKREGIGLGLAISAQLVKTMGGKIGVYSDQVSGSTFRFTVRMVANSETAISSNQNFSDSKMEVIAASDFSKDVKFDIEKLDACEDAESLPVVQEQRNHERKARILLVEDDEISSYISAKALNSMGHTVNCANSGMNALKLLSCEQYDLIFMDCHLPGMSGFETTRLLQRIETMQSLLPIPVIAITACVDTKTKQQCFTVGINDCVTKVINKEAFKRIIDNWFYRLHCSETADTNDLDPNVWRRFFACQIFNAENENYVETLSNLFLIDTLKILSRLHSSLSMENYICMHGDTHRLIGACRQIGALRMELVCNELKNAVLDRSLKSSTYLLQRLGYEFLRVQRSLTRLKENDL